MSAIWDFIWELWVNGLVLYFRAFVWLTGWDDAGAFVVVNFFLLLFLALIFSLMQVAKSDDD